MNQDRTLILPIGIPGVGKSTFMRKLECSYGFPIVSSDTVREELYGNEQIQGDYNEVFDEVYRQVNSNLDCYGICILDATHCTRWSRWAAGARTCPNKVIYIVMDNNIDRALQQNKQRERVCPEHVIYRMAKNLRKEPPKENEARNLSIYAYNDLTLLDVLKKL